MDACTYAAVLNYWGSLRLDLVFTSERCRSIIVTFWGPVWASSYRACMRDRGRAGTRAHGAI